jgi:uncharacterized protein
VSARYDSRARPAAIIAVALVCALMVVLAIARPAAAVEVPYLTGRVVDDAGVLGTEARERIEAQLKAHEERTTNQVAVLTVTSLGGDTVESFAEKVFRAWALGRKEKDNGVLVVVATGDRRMRIEVGYGLEGALTDSMAGSVIRNAMAPRFKANDYPGGVEAGVRAILGALEGDASAIPADAPAGGGTSASGEGLSGLQAPDMPWYQRVLLGAFIFGIIGLFTVIGVITPRSGWFLYAFLIPFWATFPIAIVGPQGAFALLATYLVGFPVAKLIARRQPWYAKAAAELKTKGRTTVGGIVITSGGSSGSGGGGFSGGGGGGGFSGGGGSSGGGGASGGW